jgi:hypothetical protein
MSAQLGTTGNLAVDDVLSALVDLDNQPIDDHVAIFEKVHKHLRGALEARPDPKDSDLRSDS